MKDKSKVLKTYGYMFNKLQLGKFISFFIHIISNKKGS